jgi:hypothetical protein
LLGVGFGSGEFDVRFDIAGQRGELAIGGELIFGALAFLQDTLRLFLIVPEVGVGDFLLERLYARAILLRVKENSGRA